MTGGPDLYAPDRPPVDPDAVIEFAREIEERRMLSAYREGWEDIGFVASQQIKGGKNEGTNIIQTS